MGNCLFSLKFVGTGELKIQFFCGAPCLAACHSGKVSLKFNSLVTLLCLFLCPAAKYIIGSSFNCFLRFQEFTINRFSAISWLLFTVLPPSIWLRLTVSQPGKIWALAALNALANVFAFFFVCFDDVVSLPQPQLWLSEFFFINKAIYCVCAPCAANKFVVAVFCILYKICTELLLFAPFHMNIFPCTKFLPY